VKRAITIFFITKIINSGICYFSDLIYDNTGSTCQEIKDKNNYGKDT